MENYSMEISNKNIIQNNLEKIKKSMRRLKDTINRSNSNTNYRNLKLYSQKHYNSNIQNKTKNNLKEENNSLIFNNIKESPLNNFSLNTNNYGKFFSPNRFAYLNNKNENNIFEYERTPFIQNINTDFNINANINKNKTGIDNSYNEQNLENDNFLFEFENYGNKKDYNENITSRNKAVVDYSSKTDILLKKKSEKILNSPNTNITNIIDISSNRLKEDNSLLNIINNNNNNYINNLRLNRNKSAKQMEIFRNVIKKVIIIIIIIHIEIILIKNSFQMRILYLI